MTTTETDTTKQTIARFDALAHPVRYELARLIAASGGKLSVVKLEERLDGVSQPTITHHLMLMYQAGILTRTRRGHATYYALCTLGLYELIDDIELLIYKHTQAASEKVR